MHTAPLPAHLASLAVPYDTLCAQRVLVREDFNVPLNTQGNLTDDSRLVRALPGIKRLIEAQARVLLLSHLGRPTTPCHTPPPHTHDARLSLSCVATYLAQHLPCTVSLISHAKWQSAAYCPPEPGHIHLWENMRYLEGETHNATALSHHIAAQCDVFIMDAFATAHRKHASTYGVIQAAPRAYLGPLFLEEVHALSTLFDTPFQHVTGVIGGAKISTKLALLHRLLDKLDVLLVGGGMANTLLKANGYPIGRSLCEPAHEDAARALCQLAKQKGVLLPLPTDVLVTPALDSPVLARICPIADVRDNEFIVDIGPDTLMHYRQSLAASDAIIWNGPVGICEIPAYAQGTQGLGDAIAHSPAYTVAGGGDTLAVIAKQQWEALFSYISTGGGAFLHYLEKQTLPSLSALQAKHRTGQHR